MEATVQWSPHCLQPAQMPAEAALVRLRSMLVSNGHRLVTVQAWQPVESVVMKG